MAKDKKRKEESIEEQKEELKDKLNKEFEDLSNGKEVAESAADKQTAAMQAEAASDLNDDIGVDKAANAAQDNVAYDAAQPAYNASQAPAYNDAVQANANAVQANANAVQANAYYAGGQENAYAAANQSYQPAGNAYANQNPTYQAAYEQANYSQQSPYIADKATADYNRAAFKSKEQKFFEAKYREISAAGAFKRLIAYLLDRMMIACLIDIIAVPLSIYVFHDYDTLSAFSSYKIGKVVIFYAYFILLTYINKGRTIGKMIMGIRVVSSKNRSAKRPDFLSVIFREGFCRYIQEKVIFLYFLIIFMPKGLSVSDMLADTEVIDTANFEFKEMLTNMTYNRKTA